MDMLAEVTGDLSPYQYAGNNPVMFNDPMGDQFGPGANGRSQKGPDGNYHVGWVSEMQWNKLGFYDWENQGGASGEYSNMQGWRNSSILKQLGFGEKFGKNKSGEFGFWSRYS